MLKLSRSALALASLSCFSQLHAAPFADSVAQYLAGTGVTSAYMNPASALGEPSRVTPGLFGGPVDPFNTPYLGSQLVSVGEGGSLTVQFSAPIANDPSHPYGLDFLVFGNAGFMVTNEMDTNFNFIGTPATDGSLFGQNIGTTRVSVSQDGVAFYPLNPALAPLVDGLFPTDGSGDFQRAVNPALTSASFAGLTLDGLRALYGGSGGGAGFDIGWAQDVNGQSVTLDGISFVRVEVLTGKSEIDGFVAVPEPGPWALLGIGAGLGWLVRRRSRRD